MFAQLDLLEGIVAAMDARDTYTARHSERVADFAEAICHILSLPESITETIHIAAHVHDIGKIGIPDSVLSKSSALTDDEWIIMKSHTEIGYRILEKVSGFGEIALIIRHHHERWDGKGYPLGLSKNEIPFGSRIIALSDSIDAMLSDRKYRKALSLPLCRQEIENNSGIMFDPEIVKAVLDNWSEIEKTASPARDDSISSLCKPT